MAVTLARTCRAIYAELQEYHAFYAVNEFQFDDETTMHQYLASLTPRRREATRSITLCSAPNTGWMRPVWSLDQLRCPYRQRSRRNDSLLPLLSTNEHIINKKGPGKLLFQLSLKWFQINAAINLLTTYLACAVGPSVRDNTEKSVWNLPSFFFEVLDPEELLSRASPNESAVIQQLI